MVITHELKMIKRTVPFEGLKQLISILLNISESNSREPFRHFVIHMTQEELDKFWSQLEPYNQLITPAKVGNAVNYPYDMITVNGINVTLHKKEENI